MNSVDVSVDGPGIETLSADSITETSAQLQGSLTDDLGEECYTWFTYRQAGQSMWQRTAVRWPALTWDLTYELITGLKPGISYEFRTHARNYAGERAGDVMIFTTLGQEQSLDISSTYGGIVTMPGEGLFTYEPNAFEVIEAEPYNYFAFIGWKGSTVDTGKVIDPNAPFTVVAVDGNDTLQANFSSPLQDTQWQWNTLSCTGRPDGRHETAFVGCKGRFYLIGGRESRKIDQFDPKTCIWRKMNVTTPLIHHFQPVLMDNKIYMVGAMTGNYPTEPPMARIQIYDPQADEWTEGATIPEARRRGSAGTVVYKGKIYMVCGITLGHTSGTNNWFDEYDPATDTWTVLPEAPHIRDHFHAIVVDNKLYCIGGRNTSVHEPNFDSFFGAVIREIDCYDFETQTWTTLDALLPVGSAAGGVAYLADLIIYFGGETANTALSTTQAFDPQTQTWTTLAPLKQGRHGTQAVVFKDKIYVAAGSPNRGGGRVTSIEMFSYQKSSSGRRR